MHQNRKTGARKESGQDYTQYSTVQHDTGRQTGELAPTCPRGLRKGDPRERQLVGKSIDRLGEGRVRRTGSRVDENGEICSDGREK